MDDEILSGHQKELLLFIKKYKKKYYPVCGTAIDFDMFTFKKINSTSL